MIAGISQSLAVEPRELGAHEHGVGHLNIALERMSDGGRVKIFMELESPGADIVGFEHPAESEKDQAAIDDAIAVLGAPMELFRISGMTECEVEEADVELTGLEHGENEHDHEKHGHKKHAHEEHEHERGEEHDHTHEGGHEYADSEESSSHNEFHAVYALTCMLQGEMDRMEFPYFASFPNARELEVIVVDGAGAMRYEVEREAPFLKF